MKQFLAFLQLMRLPNLLIIALTQYLLRHFFILPLLGVAGMASGLSELNFFLLSLSTVMIAAAGYIINDYYDIKVDVVNKPGRVLVDTVIKRRVAMGAHLVINVLAIAIGVYLAYILKTYWLALIQPFIAALLFFYTTTFKKKFLVGNLIVSFLTGMVVWILIFYEKELITTLSNFPFAAQHDILAEDGIRRYNYSVIIATGLLMYGLFAFFTSVAREVVKDAEDLEGDMEGDYKTMPIVWGLKKTKMFVFAVTILLTLLVVYIFGLVLVIAELYVVAYYLGILILELMYFLFMLNRAKRKEQFHHLSQFLKFIMLTGILTTVVNYIALK